MDDPVRDPLRDILAAPVDGDDGGGIDKVLHAVREHLGMDVAFVSEFRTRDRVFRNVDAKGRSPIQKGDELGMDLGYCQRVVDGRLPQLIPNAHALPEAAALPETRAIPIGAHLSVPIRLSDGRVYGTFCCFSFEPDVSLTERDLQIMKVLAEILSDQIDSAMRASRARTERVEAISCLMERGQPGIVYQPIYDLASHRLAGVEALSRFATQPVKTPDVWFNEAALVGLGPELEAKAISAALQGLERLPADIYVAVNGSPELVASGLLQDILPRVDLKRVVLEITEHASVSDYQALTRALAPFRALGLRIAIDDTGAGYSSMRHILSIEPDLVKLDISLTRGIDHDRKRRALASALIAFARETGTGVIAEGVECAAELASLKSLGVSRAQGFHLARPMPLEAVTRARWPIEAEKPVDVTGSQGVPAESARKTAG